jgi:hypothetical protein
MSSPSGVGESGSHSADSSVDADTTSDQPTPQAVAGNPELQAEGESPTSADTLYAKLNPFRSGQQINTEADVVIKVYVVTGNHGGIPIPERFCRECHQFTRRADMAAEAAEATVDVRVYSWWTHVLGALRHGGWHAPVMVVDGEFLCQGYDVPTSDRVGEAIQRALE